MSRTRSRLVGGLFIALLIAACDASENPDTSNKPGTHPPRTDTGDAGSETTGRPDDDPRTAPVPTIENSACPPLGDPLPFKLEFTPPTVEVVGGGEAALVEMKIVRRDGYKTLASVGAEDKGGVHLSFNASDGHTSGMSALDTGASFRVNANADAAKGEVEITFSSFTSCAHFENAGVLRVIVK